MNKLLASIALLGTMVAALTVSVGSGPVTAASANSPANYARQAQCQSLLASYLQSCRAGNPQSYNFCAARAQDAYASCMTR